MPVRASVVSGRSAFTRAAEKVFDPANRSGLLQVHVRLIQSSEFGISGRSQPGFIRYGGRGLRRQQRFRVPRPGGAAGFPFFDFEDAVMIQHGNFDRI